jgi:cytochrome c553
MYQKVLLIIAVATLSTLSATAAAAGKPAKPGDPVCLIAGWENPPSVCASHNRTLAATCFNCHGPNGKSNGAIPSLAGMDKATLVNAMKEFKSGKRDDYATVMKKYAMGYSDSEYEAMAEFFYNVK